MPDPRQTVDEIKGVLASADRARTPELADAAAGYAALCREANARLRRCVDYLRRGLRSEAVQLAETQPVLLELVTTLDFPDAAEWDQVCAAYGLPRAPRVMMEAAREVNEAYADEQALGDLLVRHRTLALARAPLAERLGVLRELAAKDPRSPCWDADVRTLEQARLRDLAPEAVAAIRAADPAAVDRLLDEARDARVRTPVPEDVKSALAKASAAAHREGAVGKLWAMAPEVEAACAARDVAAARRVLQAWCAVVARAGITLPGELRELVRPLNALVDADDERRENERALRAAAAELRQALADGSPGPDLRNVYRRAVPPGLAPPPDLEAEYRGRVAAWERAARRESRRSRLVAAVLVGAVGLAVASLVVVVVISSHAH